MYTRNRDFCLIDAYGHEHMPEGLGLFPIVANDIDYHSGVYRNMPFGVGHHWHKELELFYLIEGTVRVEVGEGTFLLERGQGCLINSGQIHAFSATDHKPYTCRSVVFDAGIVGGAPGSVFDLRYVRPFLEEGPRFLAFWPSVENDDFFFQFTRLFDACKMEKEGFELDVRDGLSRILLLANERGRVHPVQQVSPLREGRIKQMMQWINENLGDPLSIQSIADSVNIGERECYRLFRQYLHCSPVEYVNRRRILSAADRMAATDDPVTQIALDCGFPTPSYFTKLFRRYMGCSPREYRENVRKMSQ